jgi:Fic family protein
LDKIGAKIGTRRQWTGIESCEIMGIGLAKDRHLEPSESVQRIEPCRLSELSAELSDVIAELVSRSSVLGAALHPASASSLSDLVRIMNSYYSNLIEGHDTRPRDIERALAQKLEPEGHRRDLQLEARAHVRVQREIDRRFSDGMLAVPTSREFLRWVHSEFYREAPEALLQVETKAGGYSMLPGEFRSRPEQDNLVGRHQPPSSARVEAFMEYFEQRFAPGSEGQATKITLTAIAHHRLNYIHPFPDGNGRVSRLMSHAMALGAGIGAHGLWSISRGLARGMGEPGEYARRMDAADEPRRNDRDGRGNLSLAALGEFVLWFSQVALDQVVFVSELFDIVRLKDRLERYVISVLGLEPQAAVLAREVLLRGEVARGEAQAITGFSERKARDLLSALVGQGLLASPSPKGPVSIRFPIAAADTLFPRLFGGEVSS